MAVIYSESFITIPQKSEKVWCRWMLSGNVLAEVGSKLGRKPNVKQYVITACTQLTIHLALPLKLLQFTWEDTMQEKNCT